MRGLFITGVTFTVFMTEALIKQLPGGKNL